VGGWILTYAQRRHNTACIPICLLVRYLLSDGAKHAKYHALRVKVILFNVSKWVVLYSWASLLDTSVQSADLNNLYVRTVIMLLKQQLFSDIAKSHVI
jgi:hypothetical protein